MSKFAEIHNIERANAIFSKTSVLGGIIIKTFADGILKICCLPYTYPGKPYYAAVEDSAGRRIAEGYTDAYGCAVFKTPPKGSYRIVVRSPLCFVPKAAFRWVWLCSDKSYTLFYVFDKMKAPAAQTDVTIKVADANYSKYTFKGVKFNLGL